MSFLEDIDKLLADAEALAAAGGLDEVRRVLGEIRDASNNGDLDGLTRRRMIVSKAAGLLAKLEVS